jgi:hypothetical protein
MKNISAPCKNHPRYKFKLGTAAAAILALASLCFGFSAKAQTATLLATNQNIYVGANFSGIYTNSQLRSALSGTGTTPVTLSVSGAPAGVTILFSTNGYASSANPLDTTNSWNPVWYSLAVTNVAKGVYPLTFTLSGGATASATVNLIVGPRWINTVSAGQAGDVNWSTPANWSTGVAPGVGDEVMFQDAGNTNVVSASVSIGSLSVIPVANGTNQNMLIAPGQTLSVLGTNSFAVNNDSTSPTAKTLTLNIFGPGGSLVVSNKQGVFSANSSQGTGGATSGLTVTMTNLDNFSAAVSRFGLGDWTMVKGGGVAANEMASATGFSFAKTNVVAAYTPGDYALTNYNPTFSISLLKEGDTFNNGSAQTINLGLSNSIQAESLALAQNRAGGNPNSLRFNPVFTNTTVALMPIASFRNTNGGRMSLLGIGVDSGTTGPGSNARGVLNLTGGLVDMLVDTMWLGRDRSGDIATNNGAVALGVLTFTAGTVDVNTLIAGYQAYTNNSSAQGQINVGGSTTTNAVLTVNNNLILGSYAGDFGNGSAAALSSGQIIILTNGIVRANQITVGQVAGTQSANRITINAGGTLDVTNAVGDANNTLPSLINNGGTNILHMNGANTLIYCSNVTALAGSKISIASVDNQVLATPIPVIHFTNSTTPNNFGWSGVAPNGLSVVIAASANSVLVTLNLGSPKSVRWVGNVDNMWDQTTKNWIDTATGLSTNFNIGDQVTFDDTATKFTVDIQGDLLPAQAGVGISMTNNTHDYTFTTTGSGRLLGGAAFSKQGTGLLTMDLYGEMAATISQGALDVTPLGTLGAITSISGTGITNRGTVLGNVAVFGTGVNTGNIIGSLSSKGSSFVTNGIGGTVRGGLGMDSGTFLYNAGTFTSVGTTTIPTNSIFVNAGTIANGGNNAGTLSVNGTFEDMGVDAGTSINLVALIINGGGTFIPGGEGIGTTKVTGDGTGFDGRVQMLQGSTNIFKVDVNAAQKSTLVTSAYITWGPNQMSLIQNGGYLALMNVGSTPFAPGQSFKLAANNFGGAPFDAGLNTTNSLPNILPSNPGFGMLWDLSQVIHGGVVSIRSTPTTATNIVFHIAQGITISTNVPPITNAAVIAELSWPEEYVGWKLQTIVNTPTNGVENTNWQYVATAQFTNDLFFTNTQAPGSVFYRMVAP